MEQENWYADTEKPLSETTLQEFEVLCRAAFEQNEKISEMEDILKEEEKKLTAIKNKIHAILQQHGKDNYKSSYGTVYLSNIFQVTQPKTEEEKEQLFQYLKGRGLGSMLSVNSKTLQSFCKQEFEACQVNGHEFNIPGVKDPVIVKRLNMKRGK